MSRPDRDAKRRGLATLEMVLCLPVLLCMMALMLNYGTVATWKVRALTVARHAAWATRWPRDMNDLPRPEVNVKPMTAPPERIPWPANAGMGTNGGGGAIAALDDARVNHPVVRGPLGYGAAVDPDMYNLMTLPNGARGGDASIRRDYPLLKKFGPYNLKADCPLLDNDWRYQRMPWDNEAWYWSGGHNEHRRIPVIYDLGIYTQQTDLVESLYEDQGFRSAFFAMAGALNWTDFMAMGGPDLYGGDIRDDEDQFYESFFPAIYVDAQGNVRNIAFGRHHHRVTANLQRFCSLDETTIQQMVDNLVDRIQGNPATNVPGIPERVARQYRGLYDAVIRRFNNPWPNDPRPGPGELNNLQKKRDLADQYIQGL